MWRQQFKIWNKKVLLRERKRHTARRVASALYADLSRGVPHLRSRGGTPSHVLGGTLSHVQGGYPIPCLRGTLPMGWVPCPMSGGYPVPYLGGTPSQVQGYPISGPGGTPARPGMGYPPGQTWDGVPPPGQIWDAAPPLWPDLGWGTPLPSRPGRGIPLPPRNVNRQTPVKTVPSHHTTYAGSNNSSNANHYPRSLLTQSSIRLQPEGFIGGSLKSP